MAEESDPTVLEDDLGDICTDSLRWVAGRGISPYDKEKLKSNIRKVRKAYEKAYFEAGNESAITEGNSPKERYIRNIKIWGSSV